MAIFSDRDRGFPQWRQHFTRWSDIIGKHRPSRNFRNDTPNYTWSGSLNDGELYHNNTRSCLPTHKYISRTRDLKSDRDPKRNHRNKRHRYNKYLLPVIAAITCSPAAMATDVGGVSATANPIANSSGSVTNQAIQVLQGPYINNQYGGGISCQGPTLNITPFVTGALSEQHPYESYYNDPVYNNADNDDDGIPDNPGEVLYYIPTRTGQKNNTNLSLGLSATISIPLDRQLQQGCKNAFNTQIALQQQVLANKRLDFEIARLKNCGELIQRGISFAPGTQYAKVCADVNVASHTIVGNKHDDGHTHAIPQQFLNWEPKQTSVVEIDKDGNKQLKEVTFEIKTNGTEVSTFSYDADGNATLIKRENLGPNENFQLENKDKPEK